MNAPPPPPPPPPPHGSSRSSGLPPGNYDIFIIPPHSSGGGFLYLPSLRPHRNSFLAGVGCTLVSVLIWQIVAPVLRDWLSMMLATGGSGVLMLVLAVGVAGWAWGKTQTEGGWGSTAGPAGGTAPGSEGAAPQPGAGGASTAQPNGGAAAGGGTAFGNEGSRPKPSWQRANTGPAGGGSSSSGAGPGAARTGWEKAREETRKKEEERRKKEEAETRAKEAAWERTKTREKEARERQAREKEAREREGRLKEAREREERERERREQERSRENAGSKMSDRRNGSPRKHQPPTARTYVGTEGEEEYSFRPYDKPKRPTAAAAAAHGNGAGAYSTTSSTSYAASQSTARTTPPPTSSSHHHQRGPYTTKDPDKIVIKAVYQFSNAFVKSPTAQLVSGVGSVTDGLILRITTEGMFIDDDVRGVPQREWDVKAWTLKLVETGDNVLKTIHLLRATIRDQQARQYIFILDQSEAWKAAVGLQRLRRGTQVRALGVSTLGQGEVKAVLDGLGWS